MAIDKEESEAIIAAAVAAAGGSSASEVFTKRLFVGNLSEDICSDDLQQRFAHFGQIKHVDVRNKNDATFAFVDINFTDKEDGLKKCIDVLNNTKWKGLTLKVQLAKENFMEKLKKERELSRNLKRPRPPDNFDFEIVTSSSAIAATSNKAMTSRKPAAVKLQEDSSSSESSEEEDVANDKSVVNRLINLVKPKASSSSPIKTSTPDPALSKEVQKAKAKAKPIKAKASKKSSSSDSDSSDDEEDEPAKKKFPEFKGILAYPSLQVNVEPKTSTQVVETPKKSTKVVEKEEEIPKPVPAAPINPSSSPKGLKFNPLKKQKSDALRIQSLQTQVDLKKSRGSIIHNALSNSILVDQQKAQDAKTKAKSNTTKATTAETSSKSKDQDFLFGNEDDEEEEDEEMQEEDQFKIRPQYEGESGQRLMELSAKFGGDERFKLDERFAEQKKSETKDKADEEDENVNDRNVQRDVLNEMFGPSNSTASNTLIGNSKKDSTGKIVEPLALGLVRYQPSSVEHKKKYEIKPEEEDKPTPTKKASKVEEHLEKLKVSEEVEKKDLAPTSGSANPVKSVSTEKATYKVAANLKQLFGSGSVGNSAEAGGGGAGGFSLLGSIANTTATALAGNDKDTAQDSSSEESTPAKKSKKAKGSDKKAAASNKSKNTEPTTNPNQNSTFWSQPNPFKYDSSEDEGGDDDRGHNNKGKTKSSKEKHQQEPPKPDLTDQSNLFKSESFFFQEGEGEDPRLENIFEKFLASTENLEEVISKFNDGGGRSELKIIAKSKWRNSKRKSEKRVRVLKLIQKKKRRDVLKKKQHYDKIRAMKENREDN